jgi:hypothetical protein
VNNRNWLFVNYIINSNLDDELQNLDFKGFARSYNGPLHERNNYANKGFISKF